jgi:flagellar FliJ protein
MTAFRLATVERLRERQLQVCVQALHLAAAELARAQQGRESMVEQLHRGTTRGTIASPEHLLLESLYRERLRGDILYGDEEIERLGVVVGERRVAWLEAHAQLRAIQALHERHRAELRSTMARREQRELDELAGNRAQIRLAALNVTEVTA